MWEWEECSSFDVARGFTQISPSRHALKFAWGEHWWYHAHSPSSCCFVFAHSCAFLWTSATAMASWFFKSASDFCTEASSSWRELSCAVAWLSSVVKPTFSCSRLSTLACDWAVVDLNASLRCSSIELLCSTNLRQGQHKSYCSRTIQHYSSIHYYYIHGIKKFTHEDERRNFFLNIYIHECIDL